MKENKDLKSGGDINIGNCRVKIKTKIVVLIKGNQTKDFTYNFGRDVGIRALSYFADRNEVGNNRYEGLIGSIYQNYNVNTL